jgi:SAM-dependent methyltransferase
MRLLATLRRTFRRAFARRRKPLPTHPFDLRHGTDTSGLMLDNTPGLSSTSGAYTSVYLGISPSTLTQAIAELDLPLNRFTFIDIGCGKGRALMIAAGFPFPRLVGVEFSPELCAIARANLARQPAAAGRATVLNQDATTFELPDGPLLLFFYDSFREPVLTQFLANLERQLRAAPRETWILYAANGLTEVFARYPFLEPVYDRQIPLSAEDAAVDQRLFQFQFPNSTERVTHERYTLYRVRP